jgi:NADPH-dependent 2,4-dienoyl-CoA reductase/sulfur reductase-like enzyme
MVEGAALRARLVGIPYKTDSWVVSAEGRTKLEQVNVVDKGKLRTLKCDYLACGFHLVPNTELASLLGCRIERGFVSVDDFQQTSVENVYCAGEPTGIGGLETSLVEGKIAGLAAAGNASEARYHFRECEKTRKFAGALERAFELRSELRSLAKDETFVCRCEDVPFARLREFDNWRDAKLQTRCGMGACQGRVCGPAAEFLFEWKPAGVRPPIFPVRLENL